MRTSARVKGCIAVPHPSVLDRCHGQCTWREERGCAPDAQQVLPLRPLHLLEQPRGLAGIGCTLLGCVHGGAVPRRQVECIGGVHLHGVWVWGSHPVSSTRENEVKEGQYTRGTCKGDRIVRRREIGGAWHDYCGEVVSVGVQSDKGTARDRVV